nr:unnamed protein product [Naegleria fowleri]
MSQIYSSLPKTKGKVVLVTDCGDVEIELFSKEAPKACKNFVQLCLEEFYNGMIFHRIVADQFVQTGDPTGNGDYGESIYERDEDRKEKQFEAEYHSRLKFIQRGLVACAAQNNKSDSRFFITVNKLEALNFKHTIFGQVVGNTIYNVLKIAEMEVDQNDRPVYPPKIIRAEVIINPFDDIVPRKKSEAATSASHKRKKKQNTNILSFSDEIDDEVETSSKKQKKELKKLEKELSEVDALEDHLPSQVRNTESSSIRENSERFIQESSPKIRTVIEKSQQQDDSSVENKFSSLRKEREAKEIETLQNRTKQEAKSYLNEQMQKYKKTKKDKEERERDALQRFEKFSKGLKTSNEKGWQSHSLNFKEQK